ncbi:class I SAM-dependent methyltransferase [Pseudomonadota bacterium]
MPQKSSPYYSQSRPEMLKFVPQSVKRILDVGCGSGRFGLAIREEFPDVELYGIEYDAEAAQEAGRIYDRVWPGDVCEILSLPERADFDLIVFNDILEHIVDPWLCLELTRQLLVPGGQVLASIPNMRFWPILSDLFFQGDWRYRDAGVMDKTHLRFFTRKSIIGLFAQSGYDIVAIDGINKTWKKSVRWMVVNALSLGRFEDCVFPQFAVVATPASNPVES